MAMEAYDLSSGTTEEKTLVKYSEKLEEARDVLVKMGQDSLESLVAIDSIQRFGLGYLFKDEIEGILHHHYLAPDDHALYNASLRFRLLRQHGFEVHAGCNIKVSEGYN